MVGDPIKTAVLSILMPWGLLVFFVASNYLVGGIALDSRESFVGYELLLRDPQEHWVPVTAWQYWLHSFADYLHFVVVFGGLSLATLLWCKRAMFYEQQ